MSADPKAGDGVGILTQIPHQFFQKEPANNVILPRPDDYAGRYVFFPRNEEEKTHCIDVVNKYFKKIRIESFGSKKSSNKCQCFGIFNQKVKEPSIYQFFVSEIDKSQSINQFESKLFLARRNMEIDLKSF